MRQYQLKNREKIAAQRKQHTAANREAKAEYDKQYRKDNKDKISERNKRRHAENREVLNAISKQYYEENREAFIERNRRWRVANPERFRDQSRRDCHLRRAKLAAATVIDFTPEQFEQKMAYYGNSCYIKLPGVCTGAFDEIEHVKPISKGGAHALANFRPSCLPCNRRKWAHWPFKLAG